MNKLWTLLLVNEGPGDQEILRRQLQIFPDFLLETADSLETATEIARQGGADLVLIKVQVSDVSRLKILRNFLDKAPQVPIVVFSEHYDDQFACEAVRHGAQDYFIRKQLESVWFIDRLRFAMERMRKLNALKQEKMRDHHLATHDSLTGLPNRQLFYDRFEQAVATADRSNQKIALMFIDLDRFKEVNDTLGHGVGDLLLQAVARRLKSAIRRSDTAARLGGDEFTVIINNVHASKNVEMIAEKIFAALARPYIVKGHRLPVTPSIGVAVYPTDGEDLQTLVQKADEAMYEAKKSGRNRMHVYSAA